MVFAGDKGDFTFAVASNGTLTVTDTNTGTALGVDTVSGVEKLSFNDGDLTVTTTTGGAVTLTGSSLEDEITLVGGVGATLEGTGGADTITGAGGADTITGGTGDDIIVGGSGADTVVFACLLYTSPSPRD